MTLNRYIYLFIVLVFPITGWAQVDSAAADTLPAPVVSDSVAALPADTLQADTAKVIYNVTPWEYHAPLGAGLAATDSTLRWQIWPSWMYKKNRDPGVITYRLGTIGRTNAQLLDAHEPKYQQLFWGDIRLNDPVSGTVNWNYIPHHRIKSLYEEQWGVSHQTRFYLKEYYLNEPLTKLNYDESSYDTRSLEFVVSRNFGQKTNAELSYWDRRDGGEYDNSSVVGRQIYARISHQLDSRQELRLNLLNNNFDNSMPFGYIVPADPSQFIFDRFSATPNETSASAERGSTVIGLNYYRRPADSTRTTSNLHAGIYSNGIKRSVDYSVEETSYKVQELGASVRKWFHLGPLEAEAGAGYSYFINKGDSDSNLVTDNWGLLRTDGKISFHPFPLVKLGGYGNYKSRSDGFSESTLGVRTTLALGNRVNLSAGFSTGSRMPTTQQLYWQSQAYQGNEELTEESIQSVYGELYFEPINGLKVGVKGQLKQVEDGIMVSADSMFTNESSYSSLSTTGYFDFNVTHFELSGSATMQQFGDFWKSSTSELPVEDAQRIWFKGGAYIKGYLFNRATFVKAGLAGMISPQAYRSAKYYPALDYWQSSGGNIVPSFNRLDVDLSARVRTIMVLLRYENVLDDVAQQGYFETAGYPMMGRRLIFGIRVLFRN